MKTTSQNTRVRNIRKARQRMADAALARPAPRGCRSHLMPANVTEEGQWEAGEAPQVKTSRMFVAMLALHLVAVGGLIAFHFYGKDGDADKAPAGSRDKKPEAAAAKPTVPSSTPRARIVPEAAAPLPQNRPIPAGYTEHVVREDETAESIATGNGLTMAELRQANPDVDFFHVGRRILLPPRRHVVSAVVDDTAKRLAEVKKDPMHYPNNTGSSLSQYAPNPEAVRSHEALPSPVAQTSPPPPRAKVVDSGGSAVRVAEKKEAKVASSYVVQRGDTLYSISRDTGVSVTALQKINGLASPDKLQPGKRLKLAAGK